MAQQPAAGVNVLIAEDDTETRALLVRIMRGAGYRPTEADDGLTALRLAATGVFDVAVIDVGLPGLGGVEVVAQLRRRGNETPVLMLSAYAAAADIAAARAAGGDDYVPKPFDIDDLLNRLRVLTAASRQPPSQR